MGIDGPADIVCEGCRIELKTGKPMRGTKCFPDCYITDDVDRHVDHPTLPFLEEIGLPVTVPRVVPAKYPIPTPPLSARGWLLPDPPMPTAKPLVPTPPANPPPWENIPPWRRSKQAGSSYQEQTGDEAQAGRPKHGGVEGLIPLVWRRVKQEPEREGPVRGVKREPYIEEQEWPLVDVGDINEPETAPALLGPRPSNLLPLGVRPSKKSRTTIKPVPIASGTPPVLAHGIAPVLIPAPPDHPPPGRSKEPLLPTCAPEDGHVKWAKCSPMHYGNFATRQSISNWTSRLNAMSSSSSSHQNPYIEDVDATWQDAYPADEIDYSLLDASLSPVCVKAEELSE